MAKRDRDVSKCFIFVSPFLYRTRYGIVAKKSKNVFSVIPAEAGIQSFESLLDSLSCPPQADSRE
jgi:hypothetical protein